MAIRSTNRRWIAGAIGFSVLLALFAVVALQFYLEWRTEAMLAAARQRGEPITLTELEAFYPSVSPQENAAPLYLKPAPLDRYSEADTALAPFFGEYELPAPNEPIPPENLAASERLLDAGTAQLELLHAAAELPGAHFALDFTAGLGPSLSHLSRMYGHGRWLGLETIVAAERHASEQGVEAAIASLAVAEALRTEPIYTSQEVRLSTIDMATRAMERLACRTALTDAQMAELIEALLATDDPDAEWRALIGDRCFAFAALEDPMYRRGGWSNGILRSLYSLSGLKAVARRDGIALQAKLLETALLPYHERIAAEARIQQQIENALGAHDRTMGLLFPHSEVARSFVRIAASTRAAAVALALERYRLATGALPDSLESLAPAYIGEVPLDPYSGAPLLYARTERGFVVYSVGFNGADDGGRDEMVKPAAGGRGEPLDLPFRIEH